MPDDMTQKFLLAAVGVGLALLCFFLVLKFLRNRAPSPFLRGGRNRQPRLQVLDAAAVDARRRLVLVRRDDVEHLIMIGGPTDVVIESRIRGSAPVALDAVERGRSLAVADEEDDEAYLDEEDDDTVYPAPAETLPPAPVRAVAAPDARIARPMEEPLSPAEEWRMRADARADAPRPPAPRAEPVRSPAQAAAPSRVAAEPSLFPEAPRPAARPATPPPRPAPPAAAAPVRPAAEARPSSDFDRAMEEEMVRTLEAAKQQAQLGQQQPAPQGQPRTVTLQPKRPDVGPVPVPPARPAAPVADQRTMQKEMARIFGETGDKS